MKQFLKALLDRRNGVQARIEQEQAQRVPDQLRLSALKRLKLRFRDQIEFIERIDRHGEKSSLQVIRRRSMRPSLSVKT